MSSNNHNQWCVIVFRLPLGQMVEEQQKVCLHQICLTESIELKLWRFSLQVNFVKPATKGKKGGAKERADWLRTVLSLNLCFVRYHDLMLFSHCLKIIFRSHRNHGQRLRCRPWWLQRMPCMRRRLNLSIIIYQILICWKCFILKICESIKFLISLNEWWQNIC